MRQDEEALVGQSPDHGISHRFWFQRGIVEQRADAIRGGVEHWRAHALRAETGDLDPAIAVGDGQPFGERNRRVLGHRVRRRSDLRQESGGRRGLEQVAAAGVEHRREHRACGVDVRHDVHLPCALPISVGGVDPAGASADACVRAEQVDRSERVERRPDRTLHVLLDANIRDDRAPANLARNVLRRGSPIDHYHRPRAVSRKAPAQRPPNPARPARDDDNGVTNDHTHPH